MPTQITPITTRREFLRRTVLGGALAWTTPSFVSQTFAALDQAAQRSILPATGRDHPILVVLQLAGGNDGLNTVVPYTNDFYYQSRPRLALRKDALIPLNDYFGLPNFMTGFKELYDAGQLAMIQGVGYPNPNRSHFRSTEIWHTSADSERAESYGWVGRYFDNQCQGCDATVGLSVGKEAPQAFTAATPTGVSLTNPKNYAYRTPAGEEGRKTYRKLNMMGDDADADGALSAGGTIGSIGGMKAVPGTNSLDFLERTAMDAQISSEQILAISNKGRNQVTYPNSSLSNDLSLVSKLIAGGMATRVYYLSQGGYDTHRGQDGPHRRLLGDFSAAIKAFLDDLRKQGNLERVLILTFSEFGRRVGENGSGGTDHGTAAPVFLAGARLNPGLIGTHPSLAPADLDRGDLRHTTDFRSVYATVLEKWLRVPASSIPAILGRSYPTLNLGIG
jgi:uncharacterized protein (DUF1501 family)